MADNDPTASVACTRNSAATNCGKISGRFRVRACARPGMTSSFRPDRVGGALDEGRDFCDVGFGQLAREVGHALVAERSLEHKILEVLDRLLGDIAEVSVISAVVDAWYAMALRAGGDVERSAVGHVLRIVLHAGEQALGLIFDEGRRRRVAVDGKGVN